MTVFLTTIKKLFVACYCAEQIEFSSQALKIWRKNATHLEDKYANLMSEKEVTATPLLQGCFLCWQ